MKKKMIAVLVFFLVISCLSVFASGRKEIHISTKMSMGLIGQIVSGIGTKFSTITTMLVYDIHPFPNIMTKFYDLKAEATSNSKALAATDAYENKFSSDLLLLSDDYYNTQNVGEIKNLTDQYGDPVKVAVQDSESGGYPGQKARWSLTASLFAMAFAAEVAFTAVMGYVAPQQEGMSLLKELGAKAAKTFLLFILAASLPFLIEGVRYGLFRLANTYSGAPLNDDGDTIEMDSMFEMPETFMTLMSFLMDKLSWRSDVSPLFNNSKDGLSGTIFGKLIAGLIYILFEIFIAMEIVKAGLHILMNVVEVYLLLSCVMILLPFTIFTPSKEMVRGCVTSLFMNLIECFILCIIVIIIVPACLSVVDDLYRLANALLTSDSSRIVYIAKEETEVDSKDMSSGTEITYELECIFTSDNILGIVTWSYEGATKENKKKTETGIEMVALDWNSKSIKSYADMHGQEGVRQYDWDAVINSPPKTDWTTASNFKSLIKNNNLNDCCKEIAITILNRFCYTLISRSSILSVLEDTKPTAENIKKAIGFYTKPETTENWQKKVIDTMKNDVVKVNGTKSIPLYRYIMFQNSEATESDETNTKANDGLIANLIVTWTLIFIPCYFVKQSSHITAGLQRGSVGMESFSNALSTGLGAIKSGFRMTANLAGLALKGANGFQAKQQQANMNQNLQSITEILQRGNNPGGDASGGNSGGHTTPS